MSDLDVLRELKGRLLPPHYEDLVAVARKRRRRSALAAAACVAAIVLGVGLAGPALSGGHRAVGPVKQPSPSRSGIPTTGDGWTPERIRAEGRPKDLPEFRKGPSLSGLDAQLYCAASSCAFLDSETNRRWALEVTQKGQSALFDVRGIPWGRDFDDDSILVEDGTDQAVRFRLLQADGTAVQLRVVSDPVPAIPGPDVMLISDLDTYRRGYMGPGDTGERPYLVDDFAGTIRPLDVPEEVTTWGPNVDEFLWGWNGCRVIWQRPDGSFDHHDFACLNPEAGNTDPAWDSDGSLADWLEPGRLLIVEWSDSGAPLVVHASLDRGATWQRVKVRDRDWSDPTMVEIADALAEAMRQLT